MVKQRDVAWLSNDLARKLKPRQMFALSHPVPVGAKGVEPDHRYECRQVIGHAEWRARILFDMNGSPNLFGPCWRVVVELRRSEDLTARPVFVGEWSDVDKMQAKAIALAELRRVGHGAQVDVFVGDAALEVFKLASVSEAAVAGARLQAMKPFEGEASDG